MGLKDKLFQKTLFVDTAPLIYYIEGESNHNEKLIELFKANDKGEIHLQTSTLTLLEVLVQPIRLKKFKLADQYEEISMSSPNIDIFDVDINISRQAAELRANYNLKTPDSIQLASGIQKNADIFFTNDKNLKRVDKIEVLTHGEI